MKKGKWVKSNCKKEESTSRMQNVEKQKWGKGDTQERKMNKDTVFQTYSIYYYEAYEGVKSKRKKCSIKNVKKKKKQLKLQVQAKL